MPKVNSLAELNEKLVGYDARDDDRRIENRAHSVGRDFAIEAPPLRALPTEVFETGLTLTPRVDRYARITVRQCRYSVPAKLIGRRLRVLLRATEVLVFDGARQVATHPRCTERGGEVLDLDHYLEVLGRNPGALPGATALAQARKAGMFTATHVAFWAAARTAGGDTAGTTTLIEVLLLHRRLPAAAVIAGMKAALTLGVASSDVVADEARRAAAAAAPLPRGSADGSGVLTLPERPTATTDLPADDRPTPSVTPYDELLRRRAGSEPHPATGEAI
ncbi:Mu transposase domain-containing protein [Pengzhenrongella phosphoraccumulans]|uniref:Mu transposase domain-containing protein n=1 Tax=Pengzhenrongella phosphoraccumulans TaxID=3114394 RepID=UPI00388FB19D